MDKKAKYKSWTLPNLFIFCYTQSVVYVSLLVKK